MTTNQVPSQLVNFSFAWTIDWSEFRDLSAKRIEKYFSTSYKNVVYFWSVNIGVFPSTPADKFGIYFQYQDGPTAILENVNLKVTLLGSDAPESKRHTSQANNHDYKRNVDDWGWRDFDTKDIVAFREKYKIGNSGSLICQVTLQIPTDAFSFKYEMPMPTPPKWLYKSIDDPENSIFSNAKLISRDGRIFYCHKDILASQSDALAAMFRYPLGENQEKDTYPFPKMGDESLKAFLEFLYIGQFGSLTGLPTKAIIETADAAEQYALKELKEACRCILWSRAVEIPTDCFDIAYFSDLHSDDFKYVLDRAFEILANNISALQMVDNSSLMVKFGGSEELMTKFSLYTTNRVPVIF